MENEIQLYYWSVVTVFKTGPNTDSRIFLFCDYNHMEEKYQPYHEHYNSYLISFYFLICSRDETICILACLQSLLKNLYQDNTKHWYSKKGKKTELISLCNICLGHRIRAGEICHMMAAGSHKSCLLRENCLLLYGRDFVFKTWICLVEYLRKSQSNADFLLKTF